MNSEYTLTGASGEPQVLMTPKFKTDKPAIIFCHGYETGAPELESLTTMMSVLPHIVDDGHPIISCTLGGNLWGNSTMVSRVTAAIAWMTAAGYRTDKVGLIGQSMGHTTATNWARLNRAKATFVISSMGVVDLAYIHSNGTYQAAINAAYGGAYSNATYGDWNPAVNTASKFSGLPWLGFSGTTDTTCPTTYARAFRTAVGSTAQLVETGGGHTVAGVAEFDPAKMIDFINTNRAK